LACLLAVRVRVFESQSIWSDFSEYTPARSYEVTNLMEAGSTLSGVAPRLDRIDTLKYCSWALLRRSRAAKYTRGGVTQRSGWHASERKKVRRAAARLDVYSSCGVTDARSEQRSEVRGSGDVEACHPVRRLECFAHCRRSRLVRVAPMES